MFFLVFLTQCKFKEKNNTLILSRKDRQLEKTLKLCMNNNKIQLTMTIFFRGLNIAQNLIENPINPRDEFTSTETIRKNNVIQHGTWHMSMV